MEIKIRLDSMAEQKIYEINYKENLFTINGEIVDGSAIEIYKKLIKRNYILCKNTIKL